MEKQNSSIQIQSGVLSFNKDSKEWTLLDGKGERSCDHYVRFQTEFDSEPNVTVSLNLLDIDSNHNTRVRVKAKDITKSGFNVQFETWSDTRIYELGVSWVAHSK